MREATRPAYVGSLSREVEGLRYWRLAAAGGGTAAHHVHGAADRDHTDTVTRCRKVGQARPRASRGVVELDLLVRAVGPLATDEDDAVADRGRADAAARGRCRRVASEDVHARARVRGIGHRGRHRVIDLERKIRPAAPALPVEDLDHATAAEAADDVDLAAERGRGDFAARGRDVGDATPRDRP